MNNIHKARWNAYERLDSLMMNRRAEIVNAIGREMEWRVKIQPDGSLRVESHDISVVKRTHYLLDAKGIDKDAQWTPLPRKVTFEPAIEEWENAGYKVEKKGFVK